jgi:hypothetical protein
VCLLGPSCRLSEFAPSGCRGGTIAAPSKTL